MKLTKDRVTTEMETAILFLLVQRPLLMLHKVMAHNKIKSFNIYNIQNTVVSWAFHDIQINIYEECLVSSYLISTHLPIKLINSTAIN
jgi:hypothetical protein